jgi:hypothetical protein
MNNNLLPSRRIFNAVFDQLVYYVENDCAEKELKFGGDNYSWWDRATFEYLPVRFSGDLRRKLGLSYIDNILSLEFEEYMYVRETYKRVKELYLWYIREYPFVENTFTDSIPSPKYIDSNGNETNSMFSDGNLNQLHPEYIDYLTKYTDVEQEQKNMIEDKLQELLKIRYIL